METLEKIVRCAESRLDYSDKESLHRRRNVRKDQPAKSKETVWTLSRNGI